MSEPRTPRALSPWWALVFLPVAFPIGWVVGQLPGPKPQEPKVAAQDGTPVSATADRPIAGAPTTGDRVTEFRGSEPAPAEVEKPAQETQRAEISQWTTLDNAVAESQRNGKPVLIDFSADWCGPCQALKRQVFEDGARGHTVRTTVIPVAIVDRVREDGSNPPEIEELQRRFQVNAFPTLVVLSPRSGQVIRTQGFGGADETLAWITRAAEAVR